MKNSSKWSSPSSSSSDDQALFERRFLEENSEFFRLDPYQNFSLSIFHLDLAKAKVNLTRVGADLHNLQIRPELSKNPYGFIGIEAAAASSAASSATTSAPPSPLNEAAAAQQALINENKVLLKLLDLNINEKDASVSFQVGFSNKFIFFSLVTDKLMGSQNI